MNNTWQIKTLQEIATFEGGGTPSRAKSEYFENGTIPWVKTLDLNNSNIAKSDEKITLLGLKNSSCKIIPKDSILIAMYGGFNQIGRTGLLKIDAAINQAITAVILDTKILLPKYLLYYLIFNVKKWKRIAVSSRKDPNITKEDIKKLAVYFPKNLSEQHRIVAVLETWDKAISLTKRLIEQKEIQKKHLMRQLLTGKTRLKGFSGKWKYYLLSEITFPIKRTVGNKKVKPLSISAKIGFVSQSEKFGRDISGKQYEKYILLKKNEFAYNKGNSYTYPQGCVYCLENYDEAAVPNVFECFYANTKKVYQEFLKHFFIANLHGPKLKKLINSGVRNNGLLNLSDKDFYSIKINTPTDIKEQQSIAEVLSVADKEISLLKEKLAKLQQQKKGLMQILLTGKVRLGEQI